MSEEKENAGGERSKSNLKRRRANKTPSSPKKLARKSKSSMSMMESVPLFEKLKIESSKIYESYIRPFIVNHPITVLLLLLSIITYLMYFNATFEEPTNHKNQEFEVITDRVNFTIAVEEGESGEIEIGLYGLACPLTVDNFIMLANHSKGYGYNNTDFFFKKTGIVIVGGDVVTNTGHSGRSALDEPMLAGENFLIPHAVPGCIAQPELENSKKVSQFYITFDVLPSMNGHAVVFGRVTRGLEFLYSLSRIKTDKNYIPLKKITIIGTKHVKEEDKENEATKSEATIENLETKPTKNVANSDEEDVKSSAASDLS